MCLLLVHDKSELVHFEERPTYSKTRGIGGNNELALPTQEVTRYIEHKVTKTELRKYRKMICYLFLICRDKKKTIKFCFYPENDIILCYSRSQIFFIIFISI